MTRPIIITAFGTSSRAVSTYTWLENKFRRIFGEEEIYWAYSSKTLTENTPGADMKKIMHLKGLLDHLDNRGVRDATVQSLHLFPGKEFHALCRVVEQSHLQCSIGMPLLTSPQDYSELAEILEPIVAGSSAQAVLIIGHGTDHPIWVAYHSLEKILNSVLNKKIYVGVVEKFPNSSQLIEKIAADGVRNICVIPLFLVAGMHFRRDIASSNADSWQSRLLQKNIAVEIIDSGLGLLPGIENLIGRHIREAIPRTPGNSL